jgi:hypothetical protein
MRGPSGHVGGDRSILLLGGPDHRPIDRSEARLYAIDVVATLVGLPRQIDEAIIDATAGKPACEDGVIRIFALLYLQREIEGERAVWYR